MASKIPWWAAFPVSLGLAGLTTFAGSVLPDLYQIVLFGLSGVVLLMGLIATGAHFLGRRGASLNSHSQPAKDWLPLGEAPFILSELPEFADADWPAKPFVDLMLAGSTIDLPPRHPEMTFNPAVPSMKNKYGHDLIVCRMDWSQRKYQWMWEKNDVDPPRRLGFTISPWDLGHPKAEPYILSAVDEAVWERMVQRGKFVWAVMTDPIRGLVGQKRLRIWAREGSPTAPFSLLTSDSWQHFHIVDWRNGTAETEVGDRLYSIHVQPSRDRH